MQRYTSTTAFGLIPHNEGECYKVEDVEAALEAERIAIAKALDETLSDPTLNFWMYNRNIKSVRDRILAGEFAPKGEGQ